VKIEFEPAFHPGLIGLHDLERELSAAFGGHRVDMVNPKYLNRRVRDRILNEAEVQFIDLDTVWDVATADLTPLATQLARLAPEQ
jgi:hypothetical protein